MVVKEEGYAYIFVSNENPTKVDIHFDDLKITHAKTNVIQYNEYYPFGLQTSTSWTREEHRNNYLYNAGNELNDASGWYETFFRDYDATLGRFLQIDPMAPKYAGLTPYNYGFNDPVFWNDPSGADPTLNDPAAYAAIYERYGFDAYINYAMYGNIFGISTSREAQSFYMGPREDIGGGVFYNNGEFGNWIDYLDREPDASDGDAVVIGKRSIWVPLVGTQGGSLQVLQASFLPTEFEYGNALLNAGSTLVGVGEQGLRFIRQYPNGPSDIARGVSNLIGRRVVGTQATANFLKNSFNGTKALGSKLGALGVIVSTTDYVANFSDKSGYDHASYWTGMGVLAISYAFPVVGILYGGGQLVSYLYNGKSLEENVGKALGY